MYKKFASIANSAKYGYAFDSDSWEYKANPFLSQKLRMFETYGDGLCQHSHDWPVTEDFATDYLFSLAAAMLADEELAEKAAYCFNDKPQTETIEFAASLIFNPEKDKGWEKTRYYSMSLLKVSRNRDKEHDDRYKELNEYHTGSAESILALVSQENSDGLTRWQYANAVREWCNNNPKMKSTLELAAAQLGWFKEGIRSQGEQYQRARAFRDAFEACYDAGETVRLRKNATAGVENYRNDLQRKADQEAAAAAATEETPVETAA